MAKPPGGHGQTPADVVAEVTAADQAGLPLLDLKDLRAVVGFLLSDEGKDSLNG